MGGFLGGALLFVGKVFGLFEAILPLAGAGIFTQAAVHLARFALVAGLSASLSKLGEPEFDDPRAGPISLNIRSASQPKIGVFGETVVGSTIAYANSKAVTSGSDIYELWYVDALAGHECNDVIDLYWDDEAITDADHIDWGANIIDAGTYGITDGTYYAASVYKELGTSTQTDVTDLTAAFTEWTTDHRGRGICYTATRLIRFPDSEELWGTGPPQTRRALVQGDPNIYDPRLDTSPGANPDNALYKAYTKNPVLCGAHFLREYCNVDEARIDWDSIDTQADICDASVSIPGGSEPRYECNGAFSFGNTRNDVLSGILSSCFGRITRMSGKYQILAGAYQAPSVTLTEADIVGPVVEDANVHSFSDRYNSVRGLYVNANEQYQEMPFYEVTNSTFQTRDGAKLYRDIRLPFTTSEYMAQRIAFKHVLQSDQDLVLHVPMRWTGLELAPGVNVTFSFGPYSSKVFRVMSWEMGGRDAPFVVIMREDATSGWSDPLVGEYTTRNDAGVIVPGDIGVPAPTNVGAIGGAGAIRVAWDPPGYSVHDFVRVYESPDSAWANAVVAGEVRGKSLVLKHPPGTTRYYWFRAVRNNVESLREPNSDTSTITATAVDFLNFMNAGYSNFEEGVRIASISPQGLTTVSSDQAFLGTYSFKMEKTINTQTGMVAYLTDINATELSFNTPIGVRDARRWLLIAAVYHPSSSGNLSTVQVLAGNPNVGPTFEVTSSGQAIPSDNAWHTLAFELDLTGQTSHQELYVGLSLTSTVNVELPIVYWDNLQLVDVTDHPALTESNFPIQFQTPIGMRTAGELPYVPIQGEGGPPITIAQAIDEINVADLGAGAAGTSSALLQRLGDVNLGTLGAGVDQYRVTYDDATGKFILTASGAGGGFVDLTTDQSVGGVKTFTDQMVLTDYFDQTVSSTATEWADVTPIANSIASHAGMTLRGTTPSEDKRVFFVDIGLTSNQGQTHSGSPTFGKHKVGLYVGVDALAGSGDVWALNTVTTLDVGLTHIPDSYGYECDFNNNQAHAEDPGVNAVYGIGITGAGNFRSVAGLLITGLTPGGDPIWHRGLLFANDSIQDATIEDQTNSTTSLLIKGIHTYGLDTNLMAGTGIRIQNNDNIKARNAADTADITLIGVNPSDELNVGITHAGDIILGNSVNARVRVINGGAVELYHNGNLRASSQDGGWRLMGNANGPILELMDSTNTTRLGYVWKDESGNTFGVASEVVGDPMQFLVTKVGPTTQIGLIINPGGATVLNYDGLTRAATSSAGGTLTGAWDITSTLTLGSPLAVLEGGTGRTGFAVDKVIVGTGSTTIDDSDNLLVWSDGIIVRGNTNGNPATPANNDTTVVLQNTSGQTLASIGFSTATTLNILNNHHGGLVTINAEDAAGTARLGFQLDPSGDTFVRADDDLFLQVQAGESGIAIRGNAGVELYHDNSLVMETSENGTSSAGVDIIDSIGTANATHLRFKNSSGGVDTAFIGAWSDDNLYLDNRQNLGDTVFRQTTVDGSSNLTMMRINHNSQIDIRPAGSLAYEMKAGGLRMSGNGTTGMQVSFYDNANTTRHGYVWANDVANAFEILADSWDVHVYSHGSKIMDFGNATIGFYGSAGGAKPTVTGSRGGNAALADLLTELATLGLITDSST